MTLEERRTCETLICDIMYLVIGKGEAPVFVHMRFQRVNYGNECSSEGHSWNWNWSDRAHTGSR